MCVLPWPPAMACVLRRASVKTLIAFRCNDGDYVLVSRAQAAPWFGNACVDFLGDVNVDSFDIETASSIERQLNERAFAWVPKHRFHLAWSPAEDRSGQASSHARGLVRNALHALARKSRHGRATTTR